MDEIHKTTGMKHVKKTAIIPDEWEISIKSALAEFDRLYESKNESFVKRFKKFIDIDDATATDLEKSCSTRLLNCLDEPTQCNILLDKTSLGTFDPVKIFTTGPIPEHGLKILNTLKEQKDELERRKDIQYKRALPFKYIYSSVEKLKGHTVYHEGSNCQWGYNNPLSSRLTLLSIRVLKPLNPRRSKIRYRFPRLSYEVLVHSGQYLSEFVDKISCAADLMPIQETENSILRAGDKYKGRYIFIDNTFYNDMRSPEATDLSEIIIEWAKNPRTEGIGELKKGLMDEVKFGELQIKIGYPYVYCHQGDCYHLIIFNDIRLQMPGDPRQLTDYPCIYNMSPSKSTYCMACSKHSACWVTINNIRAPQTPTLFCETCYKMYNLDENGRVIGAFQKYPFLDFGNT